MISSAPSASRVNMSREIGEINVPQFILQERPSDQQQRVAFICCCSRRRNNKRAPAETCHTTPLHLMARHHTMAVAKLFVLSPSYLCLAPTGMASDSAPQGVPCMTTHCRCPHLDVALDLASARHGMPGEGVGRGAAAPTHAAHAQASGQFYKKKPMITIDHRRDPRQRTTSVEGRGHPR